MKRLGLSFLLLPFLFLSLTQSAFAATYNLSGIVTNAGGAGISGASVEVLEVNTNNVVANTTTSSSGNYNVSVEDGIYDIRITPPSGSGFNPSLIVDYNISNNSTLNITLGGTSIVVSGKVTDYQNNDLKNSNITLKNLTSNIYFYGQTDINGNYSVAAPTGDYQLLIEGSAQGNESEHVPEKWQAIAENITLSQNKVINYSVQVKKVEVYIKNPSNEPVESALINGVFARNDQSTLGGASAFTTNAYDIGLHTDADGKAVFFLFPTDSNNGGYNFVVTPPSGSPYTMAVANNISVSDDRTVDIQVSPPVTVNGTIKDHLGNPLNNTGISLQNNATGTYFNGQTDGNGNYSIEIPTGGYRLMFEGSAQANGSSNIPEKWQTIAENITITQNATIDYSLQVKRVEVTVVDASNNPVENAHINGVFARNDQITIGGVSAFTTNAYDDGLNTDADGKAVFWLFPTDTNNGGYRFVVTPPAGNPNTIAVADNIEVTTDRTVDISVSPPVTVSGTITGYQNAPLKNTNLSFRNSLFSSDFYAQTNENGEYTVDIPKGTYQILIEGSTQGNETNMVPQFWQVGVNDLAITANKTVDYQLALKKLELHVQNSSGVSLANAKVQFDGFITQQLEIANTQAFGSSSYRDGVVTDSSGNVTLWLFPTNTQDGSYNIVIYPPEESDYTMGILDNFEIESDTSRTVVLQSPQVETTLQSVADTYIKEGTKNQNEGASTFIRLQSAGNNRGIVRFSQSEIESAINGSQNYTAKLRFTITDNGNNWGTNGRTVGAHRIMYDWVEGNGFNDGNIPESRGTGNGTTWNCAIDSNIANAMANCNGASAWNMNSVNSVFSSTASASTIITNNQSGIVEFDVTADVQFFLNNVNQNYGWLLKKENEGQPGKVQFGSKESAQAPQLIIVAH